MTTCLIESYANSSVVMPTLGWVIDNSSKDIDNAEARLTLGQRGSQTYIHSDNQAALQALQSASADGSAQYILKKIINKIEETETYSPATYVNLNKLLVDFELKQSLSEL